MTEIQTITNKTSLALVALSALVLHGCTQETAPLSRPDSEKRQIEPAVKSLSSKSAQGATELQSTQSTAGQKKEHKLGTEITALSELDGLNAKKTVESIVDKKMKRAVLTDLRIYGLPLKDDDLIALRRPEAQSIKDLEIRLLQLDDKALEVISGLHLKRLNIGENKLHDLHAIKDMRSLEELHVTSCPLNAQGVANLMQLTNLQMLEIKNSISSRADVMQIASLPNLRTLEFENNVQLSDADRTKLKHDYPNLKLHIWEHFTESGAAPDLVRKAEKLSHMGDLDAAVLLLDEGIAIWKKNAKANWKLIVTAQRNKGRYLIDLGKKEEATHSFQDAYKTQTALAPTDRLAIKTGDAYATNLEAKKQFAKAAEVRNQLNKAAEQKGYHSILEPEYLDNVRNLRELGHDYLDLHQNSVAKQTYLDAIALLKKRNLADDELSGTVYRQLGITLVRMRQPEEARKNFNTALAILSKLTNKSAIEEITALKSDMSELGTK